MMGRDALAADAFRDHFRLWWNFKDGLDETMEAAEAEADVEARDRIIAGIDASETWLLAQKPTSEIEAICILEVMRYVMEGGGRSGGEDVVAAGNLQAWLAQRLDGADIVVAPHRTLLHRFGARDEDHA